MTDEKTMLFGAGETQKGQQVKFAVAKTTHKNGEAGDGYVEFSETDHNIYVNGVKYGAVDASGNDVVETYATKEEVSNNDSSMKSYVDAADSSIVSHMDASYQSVVQNITDLRMFKSIAGIEAASNGDALTVSTGDGVKVVASGKDISVGLVAATASALGGVLSGGDVTVSSTGAVTVNHATRADNAENVVVSVLGNEKEGKVLIATGEGDVSVFDSAALKVVVSADGKTSVRYTGEYSNADDIATKSDVDAVIATAADGMHYRGSASSIPTADASKGDFYIITGDAISGAQAGDYMIYNGSTWDIIERNITETSTLTAETDGALIPDSSAVRGYVSARIDALAGSDSSTAAGVKVDVASENGEVKTVGVTVTGASVSAGTDDKALAVAEADADKVLVGSAIDEIKKYVDAMDASIEADITTANDEAARTVDQNALTADDGERAILAVSASAGDKQETYYAGNVKVSTSGVKVYSGETVATQVSTSGVETTGSLTVGGATAIGTSTSNTTLTLNGVELDETKIVQDASASEAATATASISNGKLSITGVSAIAANGTAADTNTYNANVLKNTIFWDEY